MTNWRIKNRHDNIGEEYGDMNVLVINCGSSSLKYQLIDSETEAVLAKGLCERIGIDGRLTYSPDGGEKEVTDAPMPTHTEAIQLVLDALTNEKTGVIKSLDEVGAVGHRLVHGGEKFACSVVITDEVLAAVEECNDLAPLHNPANLIGVDACKKCMPGVPMVGVFDTAFHQTMPKEAYMYALPYEYYEKYKVRRYGFHGTSHSFVSKRTAEFLGKDIKDMKIIVCHLGNGSSISAVKYGESIDTSMGLTPLEGVPMGTRSGDIDPATLEFLAKKEGLDVAGLLNMLNKKSGVEGISGVSSDFRDLWAAAEAEVIIEVAVPAQTTVDLATTEAQKIMSKEDTIAIFGSNQTTAEGVITANGTLNKLGVDPATSIIGAGFDAGTPQKEAINAGQLIGSVTQSPLMMGYECINTLVAYCNGETVADIPMDGYWYNTENMAADDIAPNLYD